MLSVVICYAGHRFLFFCCVAWHYTESHYVESHYAVFHYAVCHYAVCHYAVFQFADYHHAYCRCALIKPKVVCINLVMKYSTDVNVLIITDCLLRHFQYQIFLKIVARAIKHF
jgi:hypothetical protein